ncbi:unnamed protein product [Mytilus coruscus]|uniref:C2H2-type domain-containing protein n=1 Tax=Mytilus coruscus TaxID=42192 RepID=A0A6J8B827_MYTCO|nr:unnamed protein product [Mytilus coruscus]
MTCYVETENIDATLDLIKDKADEKVTWENKEAVMYTVEESILAVKKWKAHIIRSRNQEEARSSIVEDMTHTDVVITSDWAMKFLPRKYREGQVDWFAKRGINWHISVSLLKNQSSFSTITHIHVFESPTAQDAAVTSQIMIDVAKDIMLQRQDVKHIHFFSDNAGCYKSSYTLLTLQQELSNSIVSYNFCEAQNGKGPCDRRASHVKSIIRRYINEGHDVTTAQQMKEAIDREKKKDIKVKVVSSVNIVDVVSSKSNIPSISLMYNFHFTESGLRMWKAFSIGEGKHLKWNQLGTPSKTAELKTLTDWIGGDIIRTDEDENGNEEDCRICIKEARNSVFKCPEDSCTREFSSSAAVDEHVLVGNCSLNGIKMKISEKAKRLYADKILSNQPQKSISFEPTNNLPALNSNTILQMGWGIKFTKSRVTFNQQQKQYMTEKFNIGKVTGNKVDPYVAADEMRNSGLYKKEDFLSGQQISSFFSRLCQKEKKISSEDYVAAEEEDRKENIKKVLLESNNI